MIDLTPLDVRKKKGDFRRSVRGYDPALVDDFLDLVAERLEELVKQNVALSERTQQLQEQIASFRDREKALNEALVTAQELREEARVQARREMELVRREAETEAERIREEGRRALDDITHEIHMLESRKLQFLRAFRSLLDRHLAEVEVEERRLAAGAGVATEALRPARPAVPKPAGGVVPGRTPTGPPASHVPEAKPSAGSVQRANPEAETDWLREIFQEEEGTA